jgi:hypothetical protein
MAASVPLVTAHTSDGRQISGPTVLGMFLEKDPDALTFRSTESGDLFKPTQMPGKAAVKVNGRGGGGKAATVTRSSNRGGFSVK